MTVNHNSLLRLWVHWLSMSRRGRHLWAGFKEVLSLTHAVWLWQRGARAEPPPAWCVPHCMCARLPCCGWSSNKRGVTLPIFLGGVCSTRSSLCTALLFFLGNKTALYVVLFRVSTFSLLLYGVSFVKHVFL